MRGREATRGLVLAMALVLTSCGSSHVGRTYGLGRAADAALTSRPVAITPDGGGLPAGHGSVAEGEIIYAQRCANCHDTPAFPQLWGGVGSLRKPLPQKSVGSYWPYATTVYDYIDRAMPPNARVPLRPAELYALTAFILAKAASSDQRRCSTRIRCRRFVCPTGRVSLQATVSRIRKPP